MILPFSQITKASILSVFVVIPDDSSNRWSDDPVYKASACIIMIYFTFYLFMDYDRFCDN